MKRIVVLGGGESGAGAAVLAKVKGFDVFLSDASPIKDSYKQLLTAWEVPFEEGGHTPELILNADEVIKSPGIPLTAPLIVELMKRGTSVISEIEFAGRYTHAKMICITGSNGKTTTTMLTYHILRNAGLKVGLAGNVGKSLALQVAYTQPEAAERLRQLGIEAEEHDYYVIELSSFQLDNMYEFKANVAVIMNITPDHLDRYDHKMQNYIDAKLRILQNMGRTESFIYWADDPIVKAELAKHPQLNVQLLPFTGRSLREMGDVPLTPGAYLDGGKVVFDLPDQVMDLDTEDLPLPGPHNLYNTMAATLSAGLMGIQKEDIRRALKTFKGVEHRLEKAGVIDGVTYINDSKATNVNSCWYALMSMTTPTVLILGGKDKGNDYTEIEELVRTRCTALVYMGLHNEKLHDFFDRMGKPVADALSMREALEKCRAFARPGDTVLLSPCCASFDLFKSYEDRGDQFKAVVSEWADEANHA
jgi:UDP-N-acetylmuramoylalanine--D-glutamate ligase